MYIWTEHTTKSGKSYLMLNDNPEYVVFVIKDHFLAVGHKRTATYPDLETAKALVEGLFDHYSLDRQQRWMEL